MSRTGKIARLPHRVREELNCRLREGEKGRGLVAWLNSLPRVQAVVDAEFAGRPIREQNISEWRKGGYRDWLAQRVALQLGCELCEDVAELARNCKAPVTDNLASFLTVHYAVAMKSAVRQAAGGSVDLKTLQAMCADVVALRRGDQEAQWLNLERKRLALEEEHSVVRYRKQLRLDIDDLMTFLDRHDPKVKAAWSAFMEELDKRMERWVEQDAERRKKSRCPAAGADLTTVGSNPGTSEQVQVIPTKSDQTNESG
ncbi:MAG TPA: hypothetical protein VFT34_00825 [Verrucomicrobiae bacterium]|nr:hypothetical protein [Verrucomicrobiae bacterium]